MKKTVALVVVFVGILAACPDKIAEGRAAMDGAKAQEQAKAAAPAE